MIANAKSCQLAMCLIIFRVHTSILFIIKVKDLVDINGHIGSPNYDD